jgi:hypothetical protein
MFLGMLSELQLDIAPVFVGAVGKETQVVVVQFFDPMASPAVWQCG